MHAHRRGWHVLISATAGLVLACLQPTLARATELQGSWTATKADREGRAVDDIVGNQLSFTGNVFRIQAKDGKPLYAGTVHADRTATPAAIDFTHEDGALKGKMWKGIYALDGDTLTICDNAPNLEKDRPLAFAAKAGSGHVLIMFKRTGP
jgi:uncharacterized protein (TIGR03067 family)